MCKIQAEVLRRLPLDKVSGVRIGDGYFAVGLYDGAEAVQFYSDGFVIIEARWGSSFFDRWEVSPDGNVEYTGSVPGNRQPPEYLDFPGLKWVLDDDEEDE